MARTTRTTKGTCKTRGCQGKAFARGVCQSCYRTYARLVSIGETSWHDLADRGLVLPPYHTTATPALRAYRETSQP